MGGTHWLLRQWPQSCCTCLCPIFQVIINLTGPVESQLKGWGKGNDTESRSFIQLDSSPFQHAREALASSLEASSAFLRVTFGSELLCPQSSVCSCSLLSTAQDQNMGLCSPFSSTTCHSQEMLEWGWCGGHLWFCLSNSLLEECLSVLPNRLSGSRLPGFWMWGLVSQLGLQGAASCSLNSLICFISYSTLSWFKVSHVLACGEKKKNPQTGGLGSARGFHYSNTNKLRWNNR